ncbi:MAG: sulfatase [Alphaproteobacteria bacterium]|nr:sulfatase [Alphaproteobacteria bacterium]
MKPGPQRALELLAPPSVAVGLLTLWHALLLAGGSAALAPDPSVLLPLAAVGGAVGWLAGGLLTPLILGLRRLHPAWRAGEPAQAGWAVAVGLSAAVMAATLAERLLGGLPLSSAALAGLTLAPALATGLAATLLPAPPPRLIRGLGVLSAVLAPALILGGLSLAPLPAPAPPPGPVDRDRPDLLLITVDTLRADRLGVYGHTGGLTPNLDALAARGTVADDAVSASPWTVPSVAAIFTGQGTPSHGAGLVSNPAQPMLRTGLDASHDTLTERLRAAGYDTQAYVSNAFLSPQMGFGQGFGELDNKLLVLGVTSALLELPLSRWALQRVDPRAVADFSARGVTDAALAWWAQGGERPRFLWVHYIDPHAPYQADPDAVVWLRPSQVIKPTHALQPHGGVVGERFLAVHDVRGGLLWLTQEDRALLTERYDDAVRYVDQHVGRLLEGVRADAPLIAMTSDHGEELWDHGGFEHGHAYYREITHVPLILQGPGVPAGNTIVETVGHVDLAPTLLDLLDLPPLPEAEGQSLMALDPARSRVLHAEGNLYDLPAALSVEGSLRYMLWADGREALFNAAMDPQERVDVSAQYPEITARLREATRPRLEATLGAGGGAVEVGVGAIGGLRVLGYVE